MWDLQNEYMIHNEIIDVICINDKNIGINIYNSAKKLWSGLKFINKCLGGYNKK